LVSNGIHFLNNAVALSTVYHALANSYGMNNKLKEALHVDSLGLEVVMKNNIESNLSMFYDNMANCYLYSGEYEKATALFKKCIPLDTKFNNKRLLSDTYLNLGNVFMMQNKPNEAIPFLDSSIILADAVGYKVGKQNSLQLLSDAYKAKGNDKKALEYLNKMIVVKDSLVNETREKKIVELQALYETDKKEKELLFQKEQLSKQRYVMLGIAVAAIMSLLSMYLLYRRKQLKQEAKLQQEIIKQQDIATKSVLEAEENERKRIAGDLHDGVGQMMSAVKMNLSSLAAKINLSNSSDVQLLDKTILLVDESCKEVRSVSHNMMPNALLKSGLSFAVKEFIEKIDHDKLQVNLYTEGLQERLSNNVETVLYRVIQETVNNVIKHAAANQLDISLIKDADGISCTIEDNGKGFDASKESYDGIGLKNIQTRINYLKGTVEWDSSANKGTLVAIHVPL
jgi:signal transduction histidine kinase